MAVTELCQRFRAHQLQAFPGVVAMDFLDIELAHEIDGFLRDDLTGDHDRKTGRIWNNETGRDQLRPALDTPIDLCVRKADILATFRVVGGVEAASDIPFVGLIARVAPETVVEA